MLHIPCWHGRIERALWSPWGHNVSPPTPWLFSKWGKEADAKRKRMAWNLVRCQEGLWRQAPEKHSAPQEGCFWDQNLGSKVRKALHPPNSSLESYTCRQPSCFSTKRVFVLHILTKFIRGSHSHSFNVSPLLPPAKFLINCFSWI